MIAKRILKVVAIATLSLGTLTACDPPIPDSVLVEIAERSYVCEDGDVSISVDPMLLDVATLWADSVATACEGSMNFLVEADAPNADIVLSRTATQGCTPFDAMPLAIDGAAIAFFNSEAFLVNLDAATIQGIFSGAITSWADPAIAATNPDLALSDLPILVSPKAPQAAIDAMSAWLNRLSGVEVELSLLESFEESQADSIYELEEGGIALISLAEALYAGVTIANVLDADSGLVEPTLESMTFAGSQWVPTKSDTDVTVALDPEKEALALAGQEFAGLPYQAIYPITLSLCGEDTLLKRAAARFLLRQDSQGLIGTSTFAYMSEEVRIAAAAHVSVGLPTPTAIPVEE